MARLPYLHRKQLPEDDRHLYDEISSERGYVPLLYQALANSPRLLRRFLEMGAEFRTPGVLPARWKEVAVLTVARVTGAETMRVSHQPLARAAGLSAEEVTAMAEGQTSAFDQPDLAIIAFAKAATLDVHVADDTWAAVADFLNAEQLAELVLVVAFYNMVARFLGPVEVDLDPRYGQAL